MSPSDSRPDDLEVLTGPDAADLLRAVLDASGGELVSWAASQVDHRPGRSTTVAYRARVRWGDTVRTETLAARTGRLPPPDRVGIVRVTDGDRDVAVWRFPADPELPGLALATDPEAVAALLRSFGLDPVGLQLRTFSYRPGRRAVVQVGTPRGGLVVKAVRPSLVADLSERHRLLSEAGLPVPASLGWTDDGLLVMPLLPGTGLRAQLAAGAGPLPSGPAVLALLDRLPTAVSDLPRRRAWSHHAVHYADVVGAALPNQRNRVAQLGRAVLCAVCPEPGGEDPTHGDFYEQQLLVRGGAITGLLDVDTVGPGRRADDLACALAHLSLLTVMWPRTAEPIHRLGADWLAEFERTVDPTDLRHRVAGVLLSLATGPYRVQEAGWERSTVRRLDLVEQWITSAANLNRGVDPFVTR